MNDHNNKQQHRVSSPSLTIPGPDSLSMVTSSSSSSQQQQQQQGVLSTTPSPITILSNFLADNLTGGGEFRGSFTQLLAMASPSAAAAMAAAGSGVMLGGGTSSGGGESGMTSFWGDSSSSSGLLNSSGGGSGEKVHKMGSGSGCVAAFKMNRPAGLMVPVSVGTTTSSLFPVSPGFSPSGFLNSPPGGFFSPTSLSPYGMSHQQVLAQVTAQAAVIQSQSSSSSSSFNQQQQQQQFLFETHHTSSPNLKLTHHHHHHQISQQQQPPQPHLLDNNNYHQLPAPVDKPADDGYNWRKYGQKQVKGSEYPRSYYRCTHLNCPVKKKVERSRNGHITEIIYKGQHSHVKPPHAGRRGGAGKDYNNNHNTLALQDDVATSIQLHGPSDSEEESGCGVEDEYKDDEVYGKGPSGTTSSRNEMGLSTTMMTHKTVTEPKIIVQTRSRVDLLDDGYRWRKYGQKVVKGNPNPRSYYKCTTVGCTVRKHVERSSKDAESVITTYEGKHNHDVPVGRNNSNNNSQRAAAALQNNNNNNNNNMGLMEGVQQQQHHQQFNFQFKEERPAVAFLRLKEERHHN